jgi:hypothetical protein
MFAATRSRSSSGPSYSSDSLYHATAESNIEALKFRYQNFLPHLKDNGDFACKALRKLEEDKKQGSLFQYHNLRNHWPNHRIKDFDYMTKIAGIGRFYTAPLKKSILYNGEKLKAFEVGNVRSFCGTLLVPVANVGLAHFAHDEKLLLFMPYSLIAVGAGAYIASFSEPNPFSAAADLLEERVHAILKK